MVVDLIQVLNDLKASMMRFRDMDACETFTLPLLCSRVQSISPMP